MEATGLPPEEPQTDNVTGEPVAPAAQDPVTGEPEAPAAPQEPQVPHVDHRPESPQEVQSLSQQFAEMRAEIAQYRKEVAAQRGQAPVDTTVSETPDDRAKARQELLAADESKFYCPGCGNLSEYPEKCTGLPGAGGHAPIRMVSTDELSGDPENHTPAPVAAG